jgi:hypothetical protein
MHHLGDESTRQAFLKVFNQLVINIPGDHRQKRRKS